MNLFVYAFCALRHAYYEAALHSLMSRDPTHPDVSWLIVKVHKSEQELMNAQSRLYTA